MSSKPKRKIRQRATALVMRDEKLLLLREPVEVEFQLPGGGIEDGEPHLVALHRELHEETGLTASKVNYLFEYCEFFGPQSTGEAWGQVHSVFLVDANGEVSLSYEHVEYEWWDGAAELPMLDYIKPMLSMLHRSE